MTPQARQRPHVIVLNRWQDTYAHYSQYIDHGAWAVTYLTTELGSQSCPADAAQVVIVPDMDDLAHLRQETARLTAAHGTPRAVVALKEEDLLAAAALGEQYGVAQRTVQDLLPLRDKLVMVERAARAGINVPAFAPAPDEAAVAQFAQHHGYPLVIKPRTSCGSAGVRRIDSRQDLAAVARDGDWPDDLLVQTWNPDPIYYIDGIWDGRALTVWTASRYLGSTCLQFLAGNPVGAVEVDDPHLLEPLGRFAADVMQALTDKPTAIHLETFVHEAGLDTPACTLLEVGGRVGGAEIPYLWREVHGYDLMHAAFLLELGEDPPSATHNPQDEVAGLLLAPVPVTRPCRIDGLSPQARPEPGPWPYAERLPAVGSVVPAAGAYEHTGGRFRFRGTSTDAVSQAIAATAARFRISASPLQTADH